MLLEEQKETVKRRAKRVFAKIDEGTSPVKVGQHKLRRISEKKLYYDWNGGRGGGPYYEVRRDKLNRVYIKEVDILPSPDDTILDAPRKQMAGERV